ncbi:MAG: hypothetical protein NDJ89_15195 [Oligoflexia bacterium]|nr:hypothetical protein [Oligoflexia bacterium]
MKALSTTILLFSFLSLTLGTTARAGIDDSDLAPGRHAFARGSITTKLAADQVSTAPGSGLEIQFIRQDHSALTPVAGLPVTLKSPDGRTERLLTDENGLARFTACNEGGKALLDAPLASDAYFHITDGSVTYRVAAETPCRGVTTLFFKPDSPGGQALGIWQIARRAQELLRDSIGLKFWSSPLQFVWPSTADYYLNGEVNITRGDHWDVVGHEMGHGIYDLGALGRFGGGQHKIDECYSRELALSEGWASFFAAWVSVDPADPDAKFEFMVPRRAPIRFETIPQDVCRGEKNEWRVTGFFWDLLDLNDDGESSQEGFARIWKAMADSRASSASDIKLRLINQGFDAALVSLIWDLNFAR